MNKEIYKWIINDPSMLVDYLYGKCLSMDKHCQVRMSNIHSDLMCEHCENMDLVLPDYSKINKQFPITYGELLGQHLILTKTHHVVQPKLNYKHNTLICDPFTLRMLVNILVQHMLTEAQVPHVPFLAAFVCHYGYMLYNVPVHQEELCTLDWFVDTHTDDEITNQIFGLLQQLLVIFDVFDDVVVKLGHPTIQSFLFKPEPCSYYYKNKAIQCPTTLLLSNLTNTSMEVNHLKVMGQDGALNPFCVTKIREDGDKFYVNQLLGCYKYLTSLSFYQVLSSFMKDEVLGPCADKNKEAKALVDQLMIQPTIHNAWLYKHPTKQFF